MQVARPAMGILQQHPASGTLRRTTFTVRSFASRNSSCKPSTLRRSESSCRMRATMGDQPGQNKQHGKEGQWIKK